MIYLVKRTDEIGYDEYDAFVVVAYNEFHALVLAGQEGGRELFREDNTVITRVDGDEFGIILGSYCAG